MNSRDCDESQGVEEKVSTQEINDQREIKQLQTKVKDLFQEMKEKETQWDEEKKKLSLEVTALYNSLKNEEYARQLLTDITLKTDKELAKALAQTREDLLNYQRLYEKTSMELQILKEERKKEKEMVKRLTHEKEEEFLATQQATEAVVKAKYEKYQLEEENEALVNEIIDIKLRLANTIMDYENEQSKVIRLKRTIQYYAEEVATLELNLLHQGSPVLKPLASPQENNNLPLPPHQQYGCSGMKLTSSSLMVSLPNSPIDSPTI